jgi:KDO2-lipid IV(A) lauroyltransferase
MASAPPSLSASDVLLEKALSVTRSFFCFIPEKVALFLGARIGDLLRLLLRTKVRIMRENLALSDLSSGKEGTGRELGRKVFRHFGVLGVEFLRLPVLADDMVRRRVTIEGLSRFNEAYARGKGVILLSGHIGNWEMSLRRIDLEAPGKVHPVIRRIKNPVVHKFVDEHRRRYGKGESILADLGVRPLVKALSKGDVLVVLLDQNAGVGEGEFVPFFGRPACTYSSLAKLSLFLGIPVLPASSHRRPDGTHHATIHPPIFPVSDLSQEEGIRILTALYTKAIEEMIRPHPEQWIWMHRRWKTRPPGP